MTSLLQKLNGTLLKPAAESVPAAYPQLHHYERRTQDERARLHLRIDADGSGQLLVNASRVVHLNPTAAFMARLTLDETPAPQAIQAIRRRYRVSQQQASSDYAQIRTQIDELARPDGA